MISRLRRVLAAAAIAVIASCARTPLPPPAAPLPAPPQDAAATCLAELSRRGIAFARIADWRTPEGCGISWAVRVDHSAIAWNRPALMTCALAVRLWDFETRVVQPAAERLFRQKVRKLWHAGTYACRNERGGDEARLSQHALGKAIDITGFDLDDGATIRVLTDWQSKGAKGEFLREVARGACDLFSVVITPDRNAFHANHIHMDIGPYKLCGM